MTEHSMIDGNVAQELRDLEDADLAVLISAARSTIDGLQIGLWGGHPDRARDLWVLMSQLLRPILDEDQRRDDLFEWAHVDTDLDGHNTWVQHDPNNGARPFAALCWPCEMALNVPTMMEAFRLAAGHLDAAGLDPWRQHLREYTAKMCDEVAPAKVEAAWSEAKRLGPVTPEQCLANARRRGPT